MLTKEILKDLLDDKTLSTNRKAVLFVMVVGSHLECHDKLEQAEAELAELREIITDMVDDDACELDHHGYCQSHGWFETNPICPHERIKQYMKRLVEGKDEP